MATNELSKSYLKKPRKIYQFQEKNKRLHTTKQSILYQYTQKDRTEDSLIHMKVDVLTHKLKNKNNKSSLELSKLSNLKSTKVIFFKDNISHDNNLNDLMQQKQILQFSTAQQIQQLRQRTSKLTQKNKETNEAFKTKKNQVNYSLENFAKIINQIQERTTIINIVKKEFNLYTDILKQSQKMADTPLKYRSNNRKATLTSIYKQPSLLLSFKKNLEEDDAYVTLKYSEESNQKQKQQPNQTLPQGWESFNKENKQKKNIMYRSTNKSAQIPEQIEEKYFQTIRGQILDHLAVQRINLAQQYQQNVNVVQNFEEILYKMVEEIACEKVEREDQWKNVKKMHKEGINEISSFISNLKMNLMAEEFSFQQKMKEIQTDINQRLINQKHERKGEQKLMIKMMATVIQYFQ